MKKLLIILISLLTIGVVMAEENSGKSIVVYFSRADENYSVGYIEKGNTEIVAEIIAQKVGAKTFRIERATPYPAKYSACTEEAKREQKSNARPPLKTNFDLAPYDTIYLGYPNWWSDMPMVVYTFLESQNCEGKTIYPFVTHEGSGLSGTESKIQKACKGAKVKSGLAIRGTTAQNERVQAEKSVLEWLK